MSSSSDSYHGDPHYDDSDSRHDDDHLSRGGDDPECLICLETIDPDDIIHLGCGCSMERAYHSSCVYDGSKLKFEKCPLCRKKIIEPQCMRCNGKLLSQVTLPCHILCRSCFQGPYCSLCDTEIFDIKVLEEIYDTPSITIDTLLTRPRPRLSWSAPTPIQNSHSVIITRNYSNNLFRFELCESFFECPCVGTIRKHGLVDPRSGFIYSSDPTSIYHNNFGSDNPHATPCRYLTILNTLSPPSFLNCNRCNKVMMEYNDYGCHQVCNECSPIIIMDCPVCHACPTNIELVKELAGPSARIGMVRNKKDESEKVIATKPTKDRNFYEVTLFDDDCGVKSKKIYISKGLIYHVKESSRRVHETHYSREGDDGSCSYCVTHDGNKATSCLSCHFPATSCKHRIKKSYKSYKCKICKKARQKTHFVPPSRELHFKDGDRIFCPNETLNDSTISCPFCKEKISNKHILCASYEISQLPQLFTGRVEKSDPLIISQTS